MKTIEESVKNKSRLSKSLEIFNQQKTKFIENFLLKDEQNDKIRNKLNEMKIIGKQENREDLIHKNVR